MTDTPAKAPANPRTWPVADAKARLSEVLRRARDEGPQRVGTRHPCVVITEDEWQRLQAETEPSPMGRWLVENFPGGGSLELPSRVDPPRGVPFADER